MGKLIDLTGQRFGRLVVLSRHVDKNKRAFWLCLCDCGNQAVVNGSSLRDRVTRSCGCLQQEVRATRDRGRSKTHGLSHTPEYSIWTAMIRRCEDPKTHNYAAYGGRGITVCERWHVFENFLEDVGRRPSPELSLDRICSDGNYEPGNCRWATLEQQSYNRRNTKRLWHQGEYRTISEIAKLTGESKKNIRQRANRAERKERSLSSGTDLVTGAVTPLAEVEL